MAVELTQQVEGKQPGDTYSGENEQFLVDYGYAKRVDDKSAKAKREVKGEAQTPKATDTRRAAKKPEDRDVEGSEAPSEDPDIETPV